MAAQILQFLSMHRFCVGLILARDLKALTFPPGWLVVCAFAVASSVIGGSFPLLSLVIGCLQSVMALSEKLLAALSTYKLDASVLLICLFVDSVSCTWTLFDLFLCIYGYTTVSWADGWWMQNSFHSLQLICFLLQLTVPPLLFFPFLFSIFSFSFFFSSYSSLIWPEFSASPFSFTQSQEKTT